MSKHTPGPWHAHELHVYHGNVHTVEAMNKNAITQGGCGCCNHWDEGVFKEGDATLIAAAPDMLAALLEYSRLRGQYRPDPAPHEWMRCEEQIDAAIRKATGDK